MEQVNTENTIKAWLKKNSEQRPQRLDEEIANAIAHGIGALLAIAALVLLVVFAAKKGDAWRVVSLSIYGATLVFLYVSSTLYHSLARPAAKRLFKFFDHASIFLLIAGTYTPITLTILRGPWGWTIFGLVWALAITGIVGKVFFIGRHKAFSIALYLAMGWLILIAIKPLMAVAPDGLLTYLLLGGIFYTLGVFFYALKRPSYFHFIWHLFVLAGSVMHFFGMLFYIAPIEIFR